MPARPVRRLGLAAGTVAAVATITGSLAAMPPAPVATARRAEPPPIPLATSAGPAHVPTEVRYVYVTTPAAEPPVVIVHKVVAGGGDDGGSDD